MQTLLHCLLASNATVKVEEAKQGIFVVYLFAFYAQRPLAPFFTNEVQHLSRLCLSGSYFSGTWYTIMTCKLKLLLKETNSPYL